MKVKPIAHAFDVRIHSPCVTEPPRVLSNRIDECCENDVAQVAELHARTFYNGTRAVTPGLVDYYRTVFFRNPWRNEGLPSLVYRSANGRIGGFVGVIPRRMYLNDRRILVAVAHRLMVAPEARKTLAAISLLQALMRGPQDLIIGDAASEDVEKLWIGVGGAVSPLYSINWVRVIRPTGSVVSYLKKRGFPSVLAWAARPFCLFADGLVVRLGASKLVPSQPLSSATELDEDTLLACIQEFSSSMKLRPEYDLASLRWILFRLHEARSRGWLTGFIVRKPDRTPLGACLYYLNRHGIAEVVHIVAAENAVGLVLDQLFYRAWKQGAVLIQGRVDPQNIPTLLRKNCIMKRGYCALLHSRVPDCVETILRGEAFLTGLEGELWLDSPLSKL